MATKGRATFFGRAGPLVFARLIAAILTVSIPLVLARKMNLGQYGTYKQLFLVAQTLLLILPFGMAQALYFFVPRTDRARPYYVNTALFLIAIGAVAVAGIVLIATPGARWFSNPDLVGYRWPVAIYVFGMLCAYPLEVGLTSEGKTRVAAVCYLATDATRSLLMVVPVLMGLGLHAVMNALAAFAVVRMSITWVMLLKGSTGLFFRRESLREQFRYAAPFGSAMLISRPAQSAHQYAVSALTSPATFAVYSVGCFQLPLVDLLYTPTSEILMVEVGEMEKGGRLAEAVGAFRGATSKLSYLFFPLSAFLFIAAPEFIAAAFGARYLAAVPIFRVSALGIILAVLPLDGLLRARDFTRHILFSYVVKSIVTIPLVWLGVVKLGMMGGILAYSTCEVVGKAVLMMAMPAALSCPERKVGFWEALPWRTFFQAGLASVGASLSVLVVRALLDRAPLPASAGFFLRCIPLGVCGVGFGIAYVVGLWFLGVRPPIFKGLLRRRAAPLAAS